MRLKLRKIPTPLIILNQAKGSQCKNDMSFIIAKIVCNTVYYCAALRLGDFITLIQIKKITAQESDSIEVRTNTISLYPTNI